MHSGTKRIFFGDLMLFVDENVYEPAEDSFLFAENLDVGEGDMVLDLGTGCGLLGLLAAKKGASVVAVDINPYALRCAMKNSALNDAQSNLAFVQSDLLKPFRATVKFDLILFNAPYLPTESSGHISLLEKAWSGGKTGREIIERFISEAPNHLNPQGRIFLLQSTLSGISETESSFADLSMQTKIVAERTLPFFETIVLLKVTFGSKNGHPLSSRLA